MIASDIMTRHVYTIALEASVRDAANLLSEKRISGVHVVDGKGKMIGMLTEADIISKVDREGLKVHEIMSRNITAVTEETPVDEIALLMSERKIKRVPVVRATGKPLAPNETRNFRLPFDALPDNWNQAMPHLVVAQITFAQ